MLTTSIQEAPQMRGFGYVYVKESELLSFTSINL